MEQEIYESWNQKAQDWDIQVGDLGDRNRILNSDPVLWQFVGDVDRRIVLDAGCGTGYLSRQLCRKG
ncbi:methyltransferase type 11, partial [Pseudanabaenaceae cyanobacterium LEGE 13415]|nr:methyltransferase type 11 [Pseudanabaenaceae cyanobacterium LEGE 13415]